MFESSKQFYKASGDLDEVKYYIHFQDKANWALFDLSKLNEILNKEISQYFKRNCVKYSLVEVSWGGGGGVETLLEILKIFWKNKDIIMLAVSLIGVLKSAFLKILSTNTDNSKPAMDIHCWIETDSDINKIDKKELQYLLSNRLATLLLITNDISKLLQKKHRYLNCGFSIEAKLNSIDFAVSFVMPHRFRNKINVSRLLRIIKALKVRPSRFIDFTFTKWLAILRSDSKISRSSGSFKREVLNNYYLFFSSEVLSDRFK